MTTFPAKPKADTEELRGSIRVLTFVSPDNGYFVARVVVDGQDQTVVGYAADISVGEELVAQGNWIHSKWGPQFKCAKVSLGRPSDTDGIVRYLANLVKGVGPAFAKRIVDALGTSTFEVIEQEPERLYTIKGLGRPKVDALLEGISANSKTRELEVFLYQLGLSKHSMKRVSEKYGRDAITKLKENPYVLCEDFWGIGFKRADEVALKSGIAPDSPFRISSAIAYQVTQAEGRGSCGWPRSSVVAEVSALLRLPFERIEEQLAEMLTQERLFSFSVLGAECLFSPRVAEAEQRIASRLSKQLQYPIAKPIADVSELLAKREAALGITLEQAQREAVEVALRSQVSIITGGPGTGKTTITRVILESFQAAGLRSIALCAPTGKAARRASESTGFDAVTIHRLLGRANGGGFAHKQSNPLNVDVVVVDESSMVDVFLFNSLLAALPARARLVVIGDVDQLPSVGPGKVLSDLIDSKVFPTIRLTQVFRQAATSQIILNAHKINAGLMPELSVDSSSDFNFIEISAKNPRDELQTQQARSDIEKKVLELVLELGRKGFDPIREVQVLVPMRKGTLGVDSFNKSLQALLNPTKGKRLEHGIHAFGPGDKVMQIKNNYLKEVYNGDVGYVVSACPTTRTMQVEYDSLVVTYQPDELSEVVLAYAYTIHKSQGSECPAVVMPLDMSHYMLLRRNLIYTGLTRAKTMFYGVGSRFALSHAVDRAQNEERWTMLKLHLQNSLPKALRDSP